MTRETLTITAIASLCSAAAGTSPPVTFDSPCECHDNHGKARLSAKNDSSTPPADASTIQAVTPSDIFSWPGPDVHLRGQSERTGIENKWPRPNRKPSSSFGQLQQRVVDRGLWTGRRKKWTTSSADRIPSIAPQTTSER
jgi:hypothetical protein